MHVEGFAAYNLMSISPKLLFISNQCALDVSLFPENRTGPSQKCFSGKKKKKKKKTFQKCNLPDFKFYPSKLVNKKFPHMMLC